MPNYANKKTTYSEKLRDPRWQRVRLEVMQRDQFMCTHCGDDTATLNVHHLEYNGDPWETPLKNLVTLCETCHEAETTERPGNEKLLLAAIKKARIPYHALLFIADGFENMAKPPYPEEVIASIIMFGLKDKNIMHNMSEAFWAGLKEKTGNKTY